MSDEPKKYTQENIRGDWSALIAIANELATLNERLEVRLEVIADKLESLDETVGASLERIDEKLESIEGDLTSDKGDTAGELLSRIAKAMP